MHLMPNSFRYVPRLLLNADGDGINQRDAGNGDYRGSGADCL